MICDLIGPNCIGKSRVIEELRKRSVVQHVGILGTPFATPPGRIGCLGLFWAAPTHIRRLMIALVRQRRVDLAVRIGHFYQWQIDSSEHIDADFAVRDEGLIKKLFEAVPWVSVENAQAAEVFWRNLTCLIAEPLLTASLEGADTLIFAELIHHEYVRRSREREFSQCGDERVLGRYSIQQRCTSILLKVGRRIGAPVHSVDFMDISRATAEILTIVASHSFGDIADRHKN